MQSPNFQRLIVIFLSIAIVASSGTLAFSAYSNRPAPQADTATAAVPAGAFVEKLPTGTQDPEVAYLEAEQATNSATNNLADALAQKLVSQNPQGPTTDSTGQLSVIGPDIPSLVDGYLQTQTFSPSAITANVSDQDITITSSTDPGTVNAYFSKVSDLTSNVQASLNFSTSTDGTATLAADLGILEQTADGLKAVPVPRPLAGFHKSLISSFMLSANYVRLVGADPVSAAALSDSYSQQLNQSLADLTGQAQKLSQTSSMPPDSRTLVQKILGIEVAHAQWVVFDPAAFAQMIKDALFYLQNHIWDILVEQLKNVLLKRMTMQVINWVAGGPEPQFITNWGTFFQNAAVGAVSGVVAEAAPQICGGVGLTVPGLGDVQDFIRKVMTPVIISGAAPVYPRCTLVDAIANITDFQNDFRNGGWTAYSALFQPQNTILGNLITLHDQALIAAGQSQEQASAQGISGGGFKGQMACDDGSAPHQYNGGPNGDTPMTVCSDGSTPHVTTPGVLSKDLSSAGLNSAYQRLAGAQHDPNALISFVADVALSRLFQQGARGLLAYARQQSGAPPNANGDQPIVSQAPQAGSPSSDPGTQAQQILDLKNSALSDARTVVDDLGQTINILNSILTSCAGNAAVAADAQTEITALTDLQTQTSVQVENIKSDVAALQNFINNPGTLIDLNSKYTVPAAQKEADDLSIERQKVEGLQIKAGNLFTSCSSFSPANPSDFFSSSPPAPPPPPGP